MVASRVAARRAVVKRHRGYDEIVALIGAAQSGGDSVSRLDVAVIERNAVQGGQLDRGPRWHQTGGRAQRGRNERSGTQAAGKPEDGRHDVSFGAPSARCCHDSTVGRLTDSEESS